MRGAVSLGHPGGRYRPFITADIDLEALEQSEHAVGAGPGIVEETKKAQKQKAEALLERYLALGNDRKEFFELTTPLFVSQQGTYSLMVPGYKVRSASSRPALHALCKEGRCRV